MAVVAGRDDELFRTERFAALFSAEGKAAPVSLVPATGHIELTLKPAAIKAAIAAVDRLNEKSNSPDPASFAGSGGG